MLRKLDLSKMQSETYTCVYSLALSKTQKTNLTDTLLTLKYYFSNHIHAFHRALGTLPSPSPRAAIPCLNCYPPNPSPPTSEHRGASACEWEMGKSRAGMLKSTRVNPPDWRKQDSSVHVQWMCTCFNLPWSLGFSRSPNTRNSNFFQLLESWGSKSTRSLRSIS